jgi:ferredoxin
VKHPDNVPGRYYVACDECLSHALCVDIAPGHFKFPESGENRFSPYVFRQPETEEEEKLCREAREDCPMGAIYDDGEGDSRA